ncbi:type II toxin-antitoxin system RelE/ParE family toxin [Candidatus Thiosymbion oneisti]|uniref:type II toxin-antitoxin system RelE/ParE family toxin n=1 Tax=Candidatus Thiosymbion oneisti TaxID=589554 RepID=UPI000B7DF1D6|nr:killer suppression protein [Candidatus Thiosymbion oneisti]
MEIDFENQRLKKDCNDERRMLKRYGSKRTKLLKRRLAQLRAAPTLATFHPPYSGPARCHELKENRKGVLSVDLDHPYRLLFRPAHNPLPLRKEGRLDWGSVTAIVILGVEDTHE